MNIIALDCGGSFIKAAKIDENTREIKCTKILKSPTEKLLNEKNIIVQLKMVKQLIKEFSLGIKESKFCFSTQMHGFVLTDKNASPVIDYISWQDERGIENYGHSNYVECVQSLLGRATVHKTGMPIKTGLPNVNLFYVLQNELKHKKEPLYFYTLGDFFIRVLTGKEPFIHATNAAATGIYDLTQNKWNKTIIEKLGFENIIFPQIFDSQAPIECEIDGSQLYFYPAIGDQQAALLGSDFQSKDSLSINLGTGGQISVLSSSYNFSDSFQTRPYFNGLFLNTIPHIPSGRAINVFFNLFQKTVEKFSDCTDEGLWQLIKSESENTDGNLDIDLSFFSNPINKNIGGSISNIREEDFSVGNLFNSIYKQVAKNISMLFLRFENKNISQIVFSGGVIQKTPLLQKLILKEFPYVHDFYVAENETLKGLCKFVLLCGDKK